MSVPSWNGTGKTRFLHIIHFLRRELSYNHRMINGCFTLT